MKTKAKIIIAAVLAIAISIGSIAIYKHITGPKEESIPLETTLEDAAELTTQKMIISDVFRSTKGEIPLINKNRFLVQYKTDSDCGTGCTESCHKGDRRQDPDIYSALHGQ